MRVNLNMFLDKSILIIGFVMALYHMISAFYYFTDIYGHLNLHLMFAFTLVFMDSISNDKRIFSRIMGILILLLSVSVTVYIQISISRLQLASGTQPVPKEVVILGIILVFALLEGLRRSFGIILPLIILIFIAYPLLGKFIPGFFRLPPIPWERVVGRVGFGDLGQIGIYGSVLSISANVVFLFIVFGSVLQTTGGTRFFMEVGKWFGKKFSGGAALSAVVTSALLGMITGSPIANIATTGTFTIPLMKKAGYKPYQAGAIEATASTGGALMPPIMGVAAFIMAAFTGIPYVKIIVYAFIPAILYFLSVALYTQFQAKKMGITSFEKEQVDYQEMAKTAPLFLIPLILMIVLLITGRPLDFTMSLTIMVSIGLSLIRKDTRPSFIQLVEHFSKGAVIASGIAMACGCIGMLLGALGMTGLTIKLPHFVQIIAGDNLTIALLMAMTASIILGATTSSVTAYVLVALVITPALIEMGLTIIQSHMFSYYFSCLFFITPPVAVGSLVAAKIAGARFFETSFEAVKIALGGFVVPYLFIWIPGLLLDFQDITWSIFGIIISFLLVISFQIVVTKYFITKISNVERLIFIVISLSLFLSLPYKSYLIAILCIIGFICSTIWQWRKNRLLIGNARNLEPSIT